jgi:N-methylhydantoinase B
VSGAVSRWPSDKTGRVDVVRADGTVEQIVDNKVLVLESGERFITRSAGGGAVGDPFRRDPAKVRDDVLNGFVSVRGAREEYGVVLDDVTLEVDRDATTLLRNGR